VCVRGGGKGWPSWVGLGIGLVSVHGQNRKRKGFSILKIYLNPNPIHISNVF
jgi:hypothetical protein